MFRFAELIEDHLEEVVDFEENHEVFYIKLSRAVAAQLGIKENELPQLPENIDPRFIFIYEVETFQEDKKEWIAIRNVVDRKIFIDFFEEYYKTQLEPELFGSGVLGIAFDRVVFEPNKSALSLDEIGHLSFYPEWIMQFGYYCGEREDFENLNTAAQKVWYEEW